MAIQVGIIGGTGYGGREVIRLLAEHPDAELCAVASTSAAGTPLGEVLPSLAGTTDIVCEAIDPKALAASCDVVFLCVPSKESMNLAKPLLDAGLRVIDIGPDFRLNDPNSFKSAYGVDHTAPDLLKDAVYGLVPQSRDALPKANLVAVPGCYPISALVPLWPLVGAPLSDVPIVIDSISGTSGAGKGLSEALHFSEMNENVWAYKVGTHQHVPEMEQQLGIQYTLQFTPHVGPYTRGILTTITIRPSEEFDIAACYEGYDKEPFIRVLGEGNLPQLKNVRGASFCDFGWVNDKRTGNIVIVSAIDNLVGGTAGMAVQCMNLMYGIDERAGLHAGGML